MPPRGGRRRRDAGEQDRTAIRTGRLVAVEAGAALADDLACAGYR
jgi:hypothetical protein